jgi:hypothetical protein
MCCGNYSRQNNGILPRNTDFWRNMQVLKLLVRVTVICNICFLAASVMLLLPDPPEGTIVSTVIVVGCVLGLPLNAIVFVWALILACTGRWRNAGLSVWLAGFNFVVFCLEGLLYFVTGSLH